jgi:MFS family permease
MRGRYMAVFSLVWALPAAVGPGAAGYILDNFDPDILWTIGAGLCIASAFAFYLLHLRLGAKERFAPRPAEAEVQAIPEVGG